MYRLETFNFENDEIEVVIDNPTGARWIPIYPFSLTLEIDPHEYTEKVWEDSKYRSNLLRTINGEKICIPASKIQDFLFDIDLDSIDPQVRNRILDYQDKFQDSFRNWISPGRIMLDPDRSKKIEILRWR